MILWAFDRFTSRKDAENTNICLNHVVEDPVQSVQMC